MTSFKLLKYLDNISVAFTSGIIHLPVWAIAFTLYYFYPLKILLLHEIPKNIKQAAVKVLCLLS